MKLPVKRYAIAISALGLTAITLNDTLQYIRSSVDDCKEGASLAKCYTDIIGAVAFGVFTIVGAGITAYTVTLPVIPRDGHDLPVGHEILSVNGVPSHPSEVLTHEWMRENLKQGERTYILANSTVGPGRPQVMTEAWLEEGERKYTSYLYQQGLTKRTVDYYVHFSTDLVLPGHVHTTITSAAGHSATADIVYYMATKGYGRVCFRLANTGSATLLEDSTIWTGLSVDKNPANDAPDSSYCKQIYTQWPTFSDSWAI